MPFRRFFGIARTLQAPTRRILITRQHLDPDSQSRMAIRLPPSYLWSYCWRCFRPQEIFSSAIRCFSADTRAEGQSNASHAGVVKDILLYKEKYPFEPWKTTEPRKIAIDFSSPNIAKPFHAGHLRSTILGHFIANLYEAKGYSVQRINYLGDWGTQCGIVLAAIEHFLPDVKEDDLTLQQLLEFYVKGSKLDAENSEFHAKVRSIFSSIEKAHLAQDKSPLYARWQTIRAISIAEYLKLYERIGVRFDEISGESQYADRARMVADQVETLNLENSAYARPERLQKSDGGSLYLSRDLAALIERAERLNFDDMLYVVENGQHDHFQNLFHLAQHFDLLQNRQLRHIKFGRIRGLSTRKGNVVLLTDLLDEAVGAMKTRINSSKNKRPADLNRTAEVLALSVILINDFQERRLSDYENASTALQQADGDSGVFLQYVHARLCSLEKRCGVLLNPDADFTALQEPDAQELLEHLRKAPETVDYAFRELEPVAIVQYLFRHGHLVNRALKRLQVKNQETNMAQARLALFYCARITAGSLMKVLGLKPLEAM